MIKLGNISVESVYIGSTPALSGFIGDVPLWGSEEPVVTMTPDFVVHYYVKPEGETLNVVNGDYADNIDKVGRYNLTTGQYEVIEFPAEGIVVDENEPFQYGFTLKNKTVMDMMLFSDNMDVREIDLHTLTTLRKLTGSIASPYSRDPNDFFIDLPNTVQRFEHTPCVCATVRIWDNGAYRYGLPSGVTYIGMPEGREEDEGLGGGAFDGAKLWSGDYSDIYEFIIPASVTHLEKGAFANAQLPPRVTVNSTVGVPDYLFDSAIFGNEETTNLIDIKIAEGNTSVGDNAFMVYGDTSRSIPWVYSLSLPSTLRTIGDGAFAGMMFSVGLDLPDGLTTIGESAFSRIYKEKAFGDLEITIPASVTTISGAAFTDATIEAIHVNGTTPATLGNDEYEGYPFDNCHTREDEETHEQKPTPLYVPCEAVDTYKTAWSMYEDRISCQRDYMTPEFVVYYSKEDDTRDYVIFNPALVNLVDKIGVNDGTGWVEYDVPSDGIFSQDILQDGMLGIKLKTSTALNTNLFNDTDFHEIDGAGMTLGTVAPWTRVYNTKNGLIESLQPEGTELLINLPNTVQRVEDYGCAGLNLSVPNGSGEYKQDFPSSLTYIGDYAFYCGNMLYDSLNIPAGVTHIGTYALATGGFGVNLNVNSTVGIPEGFNDSNYFVNENLTIANGNTFIGDNAFRSCHFSGVSLPNTLQTIGDYAFEGFVNESSDGYGSGITIPAGVTTIGDYAFQSASIPAIYFSGATPPTIGTDVFTDCNTPSGTPTPIYVPCSAVDAYKAAAGWSTYADRIQCIPSPEPDPSTEYFHFISLADGSQVKANSKFQYSLDGGNTWTAGDDAMKTINSGDTIYFKGSNSEPLGQSVFRIDATSGRKYEIRGNIMSLVYGDLFQQYSIIPADGFFANLFKNYESKNYSILKIDKLVLPSTTLTKNCYEGMFAGCSLITSTPELPATNLADSCYKEMFSGCTSLTTAPALPATALTTSCYQNMFQDCTSLTTAPALPATVLSTYCYDGMFSGCRSLTTAPTLPATTLTSVCYRFMFFDCTSLTTAPALPATTLVNNCYEGMFSGCTSLTTASELPATTLANTCYKSMFGVCTSLTTAPALPATTLTPACYQNMFRDCTSLTTAPALPATTLNIICYDGMFSGCTSLTTAPELPATTLTGYCYTNMFNGCSSLNYVKAMFTTTPSNTYTQNWLTGIFPAGTFVKNANATWDNSLLGLPNAWTVETAEP